VNAALDYGLPYGITSEIDGNELRVDSVRHNNDYISFIYFNVLKLLHRQNNLNAS